MTRTHKLRAIGLWTLCAAAALALSWSDTARAQVPCTAPDVLCTGDPCVTRAVTVASPCVLDFGSRALVIGGRLKVPSGGTLELRAGSINVQSVIDGHGAIGASVTLIATGTIFQRGRVDTSGTGAAGTITLQAGGDVTLTGRMKSVGSGSTNGGSILVESGGQVFGPATFGNDVRGGSAAAAGHAVYHGVTGVDLLGHLHMLGGSGGYCEFVSSAGKVTIGTDIRTRVRSGAAGTCVLNAATDATVARGINEDGFTDGGTLIVSGATVTMPLHQGLHARGWHGAGGTVIVNGGVVTDNESLLADGFTAGGSVTVTADAINIVADVSAKGGTAGGRISLLATTGNLTQTGIVDAAAGGVIEAEATAGNLTVHGPWRAGGGGCIALAAGGTVATAGATFDVPVTASCP